MNTVYAVSIDAETGAMKQLPTTILTATNVVDGAKRYVGDLLNPTLLETLEKLRNRYGPYCPDFANTIAEEIQHGIIVQ